MKRIWVGYDRAEIEACQVALRSISDNRRGNEELFVRYLDCLALQKDGLYRRPIEYRDGRPWDAVSEAPMSTLHANARFFLPRLQTGGVALFMDGDVLVRGDIDALFALMDPQYALMCVQHPYLPEGGIKKGGHVQTVYSRKNWSSVMLWNLDHPAHQRLTDELLNTAPGRDLHRFCWLDDDEIGALPPSWNWLADVSPWETNPDLVHYTLGAPNLPGYEHAPYANEWRAMRKRVYRTLAEAA